MHGMLPSITSWHKEGWYISAVPTLKPDMLSSLTDTMVTNATTSTGDGEEPATDTSSCQASTQVPRESEAAAMDTTNTRMRSSDASPTTTERRRCRLRMPPSRNSVSKTGMPMATENSVLVKQHRSHPSEPCSKDKKSPRSTSSTTSRD